MKIIGLIIVIAIGIVAWALFNPDQQENLLAVKDAIGIDSNNPYAKQMRTLSEKQRSVAGALGGSSSLNGAQLTGKVIATQTEIIREFGKVLEGLRKSGDHDVIILDIEDSGVTSDLRTIKQLLKDGKYSDAAEQSRQWASRMEAWANELDGSD